MSQHSGKPPRTMRAIVTLSLLLPLLPACNRAHLYKTAGMATRRALDAQLQPHDGPKPRGLDGDEAALIVGNAKKNAALTSEAETAVGKPGALILQSR